MKTGFTSTEFGSVFNIVVNQEPILEEFKRGSGIHSTFKVSAECFTHEHAKSGP
jgi:hypothetical protein